ncbi:hypothetical protein [Iodidimonas sp. SYSU 1G8]|uniref:hypothetical protein n=1 Tax=Iodidimonas sp. SYSU 1G8 TaxID=3133967 RepID=UPI0031FEFB50
MPLTGRARRAALILSTASLVAACVPDYEEVVVRDCTRDGQSGDYCSCVSAGMKQALGPQGYAVFTSFILLGGTGKATRDDIMRLMDRHKLSPEQLAETQDRIAEAMPLVHARCEG